jgi:type IV pilus assembly protein PilC
LYCGQLRLCFLSMTEFVIRLADERGRVQEQTHAAATAEELRARFTQAGYYVYSVKARGVLAGQGKTKKVKLEPFLVFNALPILGSIELLARRQKIPHFRAQLEDIAVRVKNGESISESFEAQGGFPVVYTTTLLAGERSGNLEEVLQRYLDFQRVSLTFRKKLTASLIYPAVLVVMVIGLFIFLITFVVPRFAELYEQLGTKLPAITTFLLALGKNAQSYGIYFAAVLAIVIFLLIRWMKTDAGATLVDKVRISLPLIGNVWLKYQVGLFRALCRRC